MIASLWLYAYHQINYDYARTIEEASHETMNLAKAYEAYVQKNIADADNDLRNIKEAYEQGGLSSPIVAHYLKKGRGDLAGNQIVICNKQGLVVGSLIEGSPEKNYSEQAYFKVHRDSAADALYLGLPIQFKAKGQSIIPLSRRINNPDGSFGGIACIGLNSNQFLDFEKTLDIDQNQLIVLFGVDGFNQIGRINDNMEMESGQEIRYDELWTKVQSGQTWDSYLATDYPDGVSRVMSYRVMSNYPIIISVAKSMQVVLADFEKRKRGYILGDVLISLFIVAFCCTLIRYSKKQLAFAAQLIQINNKMAAILDSISDPFYVLDKEWKLTYINNESAQTGIELHEKHVGQNIWNLYPDLVGEEQYYNYHKARATGTPIHATFKGLSGEEIFDTHLYPYANGLFVYCRNITEQKKYETDLLRLDRLSIIGEMAASIGHEVRNPMTTVRGYLQWFKQKDVFTEYHESFVTMIDELDRANSIIADFLSVAKNKTVAMKLTDLNEVIRGIFPLLQADALLRGNDIELELQGTLEIFMDQKEIRQCILNLVGNGLDSMPDGGKVTISTAIVENQVVMTVRDRGMGMPPEVKAKLWTPFFTTKEKGTGLGLPVCYKIAQRHEATIEVETGSEGTAFHFIFNQKKTAG